MVPMVIKALSDEGIGLVEIPGGNYENPEMAKGSVSRRKHRSRILVASGPATAWQMRLLLARQT
jgi:hypothetical protein